MCLAPLSIATARSQQHMLIIQVLARPSDSVTHLIYKSGKPSTLTWYRKQAAAAAEAAEEAEYQARLDQEARMDTEIAGSGPSDLGVKVEPDQMGTGGKKQVGPYIVGLSWVTRCKAEGKRVDEAKYAVDVKEEDVFGKVCLFLLSLLAALQGRGIRADEIETEEHGAQVDESGRSLECQAKSIA